ncbi:MAG: type II toxin-antitoxin system prevent-host-death family antitoxin [Desulfatiglans sp.]|nr:type II toxin-antitoxin system prevent-host-death family antitoxin [Desulfatiglans sp.]
MENIGVKELRDNLSSVLKKVESGEVIRIMRHGKAVVEMQPLIQSKEQKLLNGLQKKGLLGGGTGVLGNIKTIKNAMPDKPVSEMIVEDRR